MLVTCNTCQKPFDKPACWVKRVKIHFCSTTCHVIYQRQFKVSKECGICKEIFYLRPSEYKRFSTCEKESCRAIKKQKENNGMWKGGIKSERKSVFSTTRYKYWRKLIFERDNYTCVKCNTRGGKLNADHILPYAFFPELRFDLNNGRTLCLTCHKETYKYAAAFRDGNIPIIVKDIRDNSFTVYPSIMSCADAFNVKRHDVYRFLENYNKGKLSLKHFVFVKKEESWPTIPTKDIGRYSFGKLKEVVATSKKDNAVIIFENVINAAKEYGIEPSELVFHMLHSENKPYHGWIFRYIDDLEL